MIRCLLRSIPFVVVLAGAAASFGQRVTATFDGAAPARIVTIHQAHFSGAVYAGVYNGAKAEGAMQGEVPGFCFELQPIEPGQRQTFNVRSLGAAKYAPSPYDDRVGLSELQARQLRELWGRYRHRVVDADSAAAFQLAVWELVYDDDRDVTDPAGRFFAEVGPALARRANGWLQSLDGTGPQARRLHVLNHPDVADQLVLLDQDQPPNGGAAMARRGGAERGFTGGGTGAQSMSVPGVIREARLGGGGGFRGTNAPPPELPDPTLPSVFDDPELTDPLGPSDGPGEPTDPTNAVPEPTSAALLLGLLAVTASRRRGPGGRTRSVT
jgi:hypothetical protein